MVYNTKCKRAFATGKAADRANDVLWRLYYIVLYYIMPR